MLEYSVLQLALQTLSTSSSRWLRKIQKSSITDSCKNSHESLKVLITPFLSPPFLAYKSLLITTSTIANSLSNPSSKDQASERKGLRREMNPSQAQERFSEFFETWVLEHESNHEQLLIVPKDTSHEQDQTSLISKFMNHYKEYYSFKWSCVKDDVLGFFYPPWLTPFEQENIWMTGFKPLLIFRLVKSLRKERIPGLVSLSNLTEEQVKKIRGLRSWTSMEEEKLELEMERLHVISMTTDRPMVELGRRIRDGEVPVGGGIDDEELVVALRSLLSGLERIVKVADCIRMKTLKGIVGILTPLQAVDFLAAVSMLQIQTRKLGMRAMNQDCTTIN